MLEITSSSNESAINKPKSSLGMILTLQQLLEIQKTLLGEEEKAGMLLAEYLWTKNGEPRSVQKLILILQKVIDESIRTETRYPRILLKRLKELERGIWKPCAIKPIGINEKSAAEKKLGI